MEIKQVTTSIPEAVSLTSITLDITEPFQMSLKDMQINAINILVGQNGSGKSFLLINFWAMGFIANVITQATKLGQKANPIEVAQFTYNNSFTDQNIDGMIQSNWSNGSTITIIFKKGIVKDVNLHKFKADNIGGVKFMSSHMRTFDNISMYLKMRKMFINNGLTDDALIMELTKHFKLYDIMMLEEIIHKMPFVVDDMMKERLKAFDIKEDITLFDVDLDKGDFFLMENNNKKYLTSYGKGHQSLFNMTLTSSI